MQVAPPWFAVPPSGYGGIEAVVALLSEELVQRGHDVTLVASGGSQTTATLRSVYDEPPSALLGDVAVELPHLLEAYLDADVDVIHDHSGLIGPALAAVSSGPPVVHTLHGPWTETNRPLYRRLADHLDLVAISHHQAATAPPDLRLAGVVHNGIDLRHYPMQEDREDYLLYVGRATPDKGPLGAVDCARRLGRRLVMLLKVNEPKEQRYFREVIAPALDGVEVELRGGVSHEEKIALMGRASCLVFPIQWPEPFGLVMVEAMATGTPVVVYAEGAAPELIAHGESGYLVAPRDREAFCEAVRAVEHLDPRRCRAHVESHFTAGQMVDRYLNIYARTAEARTGIGVEEHVA